MKVWVLSGMNKDSRVQEWKPWGLFESKESAMEHAEYNRLMWIPSETDPSALITTRDSVKFRLEQMEVIP